MELIAPRSELCGSIGLEVHILKALEGLGCNANHF
jgi:hypothetical protein